MHELSTVNYIVETVDGICKEQGLTVVQSVTVQIGEVSAIIPEYIVDYYNWLKQKNEFLKDSEIICEKLDAVTYCQNCKKTYPTVEFGKTCPHCGSGNTFLVTGNEYIIKEIVAM